MPRSQSSLSRYSLFLRSFFPPVMGVPSLVIILLGRSLGARSLPLLWLIASAERDWSRWMVALWSLSSLRPWASSCRSPSCSWAPVGKDRFVEEEHDQTWFLFFWWASYSQTCLEHKCYQRIPENQYAQTFMGCYHVLFPDQPLSGLLILTSGSASRVAATLARFHQIWWDLGESKNAL